MSTSVRDLRSRLLLTIPLVGLLMAVAIEIFAQTTDEVGKKPIS